MKGAANIYSEDHAHLLWGCHQQERWNIGRITKPPHCSNQKFGEPSHICCENFHTHIFHCSLVYFYYIICIHCANTLTFYVVRCTFHLLSCAVQASSVTAGLSSVDFQIPNFYCRFCVFIAFVTLRVQLPCVCVCVCLKLCF